MKNYTLNNLIIANLLGYTKNEQNFIVFNDSSVLNGQFYSDRLFFHSDWNWLMGVVEKIESLGYLVNIFNKAVSIHEQKGEEIVDLSGNNYSSKFEAVYTACIHFIEWYNDQDESTRTDSVTGRQITEGYCFNDGEFYCESKEDATEYAKSLGYESLDEAYEDEAYYWTQWEELPREVQTIMDKFSTLDESYENARSMVEELEAVGYTGDFGLDGIVGRIRKKDNQEPNN